MTRFARARGSKASNEKVPEEATSWKDMKRQLQESQVKQENPGIPTRLNMKQLLHDDTSNSRTEWATFEDEKQGPAKGKKGVLSKTHAGKVKKSKKLKVQKTDVQKILDSGENKIVVSKKKKFHDTSNDLTVLNASVQNVDANGKHQNRKMALKIEPSMDTHLPSLNKSGINFEKNSSSSVKGRNSGNGTNNKQQKKKKLSKNEKIESGKPYKRRKPLEKNMVMSLNGREISVSYFDGFIVKSEDAERLEALEKKLKEKGIVEAEIKEALKLERRKSEKVLAREKKKVCFHCRMASHVLSECPSLTSSQIVGICYKCGSTEHRIAECRVSKSDKYRFARCFICSEQGHISAQCPKNSNGLYPKGGSCYICGDITHLKKDCPKLEQQQESQSLTVGTINGGSLEALDGETKPKPANNIKKGKNAKRVFF